MNATRSQSVQEFLREARFWLALPRIFSDAFPVERLGGRQYFLINELLNPEVKTHTVSSVMSALQNVKATRSNAINDVTLLLDDLCELDFVRTILGGVELRRDPKLLKYFPVEATVEVEPALLEAGQPYIRDLVALLFGNKASDDLDETDTAPLMAATYSFMVKTYVPTWTNLLRDIALELAPLNGKDTAKVQQTLTASSEYFILLHVLWARRMEGDDLAGLTRARLGGKSNFSRPMKGPTFETCLKFLIGAYIVLRTPSKTFRLNGRLERLFEAYAKALIPMRIQLESELRKYPKLVC